MLLGSIEFTGTNNPINTLTTFAGTHTRGAAAPLCPTCLRPLLESYVLKEI